MTGLAAREMSISVGECISEDELRSVVNEGSMSSRCLPDGLVVSEGVDRVTAGAGRSLRLPEVR